MDPAGIEPAPATRSETQYKILKHNKSVTRLSVEEKSFICDLIENGISLAKISSATGRGKSTLYHYYKKIKGKKFHEPEFETNYSELEGEVVGIFAGDGSQYHDKKRGHYEVNVHFGKTEYSFYVKELFEKYFNKKFRLRNEGENKQRLRTESKKIFNHFKNYIDYVPQTKHSTVKLRDIDFPKEFKIGFIRGFLDTDGCISLTKDRRTRIVFTTTSKDLAEQIKQILLEFGLQANTRLLKRKEKNLKDCYHTYLFNGSVESFIDIFKPYKAKVKGLLVQTARTSGWQSEAGGCKSRRVQ